MGGTFFNQNNLEERLNETVPESPLPDSVPVEQTEPLTLEDYYIEIGKELRQDFYDSELGSTLSDLYFKYDVDDFLENIGYIDLQNLALDWLRDNISELFYYSVNLSPMGALIAGGSICYATNLKS